MFGLALDKNNDIFIEGGTFKRTYDGAYIVQKVRSVLNTVKGEVSSDPDFGIPYFTEIFQKPVDIGQVASIFKTAILEIDGVNELLDFDFDYLPDTRIFSLSFSLNTDYGTIVIDEVTIGTVAGQSEEPIEIITRYHILTDDGYNLLSDIDEQLVT